MGIYQNQEVSKFSLEGRFSDFLIKDGYKLKGLILETYEGECHVKLAKHLRVAFDWRLPKGTWLQVVGEKKYDSKTGEVRLKAESVMAARLSTIPAQTSQFSASVTPKKEKAESQSGTILVCQKSDCMKRGGKEMCQVLQKTLGDRGLAEQVTIKGTGCMKNCKAGPNLVMPDKTRYSRIQARQIPQVVDKHFAAKSVEPKPEESINTILPLTNFASHPHSALS
ncbi:(2Fe-2S) ferredoxin domain-containing protein [Calothrix sp. 336/3]|uniref:(2Fe-2S) ferredoxin domain-containing protein n=1 Tax=Calothrix sp. 336/3 TaxID=1337936 RepID=UPI0004E3B655|nr:(2Fe-2S) ferredoxin domain-containing protein [Calothrix sp. 336/3]AKG22801.1 (Fe-S)-binding protein [Calothrix sp. 336/3]